jgi:fatty-acyl-CoA synthase
MKWNFGDLFEAVSDVVPPEHPAILHEGQRLNWAELDRASNRLARSLLASGLGTGDKVAFYLRNHPAYIVTLIACFKARLVHVNVNFRLQERELRYLLENSDTRAVVYNAEFHSFVERLAGSLPEVRAWIPVEPAEAIAGDFEELCANGDGSRLGLKRSAEDLLLIYTGGTTGTPKGVMWSHRALLEAQFASLAYLEGTDPPKTLDAVLARVRRSAMFTRALPAAPLMHATAAVVAIGALMGGGTVITVADRGRGLEADRLLSAVDRHEATTLTIAGDAFARPILRELDSNRDAYELSSLQAIISSGVMWSPVVKERLLEHLPRLTLLDNFGSTEAPACGTAISTRDQVIEPEFRIGEQVRVFTEDGRAVKPGSGDIGLVARAGPLPEGYYKDPEKTARTFRVIDGVRYSIPGDWCLVEADGRLRLLGRGSQCINTGGEKVFVEEVEELLKRQEGIDDALVVGVPDDTWGSVVVAAVAPQIGDSSARALRKNLHGEIANYKIPKRIHSFPVLPRLASGKADYRRLKEWLEDLGEKLVADNYAAGGA